jgi:hypothetical protein
MEFSFMQIEQIQKCIKKIELFLNDRRYNSTLILNVPIQYEFRFLLNCWHGRKYLLLWF